MKATLRHILIYIAASLAAAATTGCVSDNDNLAVSDISVAFTNIWPDDVDPAHILSAAVNFRELNTGYTTTIDPTGEQLGSLRMGVYDYDGAVAVEFPAADGSEPIVKNLRVSAKSVVIDTPRQLTLDWFYAGTGGDLVFYEIYACGSPNATATGGLRDTYFLIYNNTDHVIYADGIGLAESAFVNAQASTHEILTEANNRQVNFTAATIWVIPGSGTDHPIQPGGYLKLVDQAIDWGAQVAGAQNHTDADFEWYDDNAQDTDNPAVANLDKWYCYSNTIWMVSNQANRSYAIVKFPDGMTSEQYLAQYHGAYEYISVIGTYMSNDKAYLIPNSWILDGVNLGNAEKYVYGALGDAIDISYACISEINADPNRFGHVFRRKTATTMPDGRVFLQDTNDSAADFTLETQNR